MIQAVRSAFALPDLRKKILITFLILAIYRLFAHVPVPGVNSEALTQLFQSNQLLGLLDLLSGGAMANFSVMAMGVYPYITASIIIQLLTPIIPALESLQKGGQVGARGKRASGATECHHLQRIVSSKLAAGVDEVAQERGGERVQDGRPVVYEPCNRTVDRDVEIRHGISFS